MTEVVLGVEVSADRRHTSVASAGSLPDDMVMIDLPAYLDGSDAVVEVQRLTSELTVLAVVVDPHSPAATLIKPLSDALVVVTEPTTSDVVVAHGMFLDLLAAGRLRHTGRPELDAAVRHGTQRPLGGASAWDRRSSTVDVSPLTASTLRRPCPVTAEPGRARIHDPAGPVGEHGQVFGCHRLNVTRLVAGN